MLRLIISSIWYQSVSPATQIPCNRQMMRSSIPFSPFSSPHVLAPSPMPYYPPYEWWTWQGEREQEQTTSHPHVSGTRMNGFRDGYSRAPTSPSLPPSKTTPASALCENSSLPLPHIHSAYCIVLEEAFTVHGPPHQISTTFGTSNWRNDAPPETVKRTSRVELDEKSICCTLQRSCGAGIRWMIPFVFKSITAISPRSLPAKHYGMEDNQMYIVLRRIQR